jgi:hypothetical protein
LCTMHDIFPMKIRHTVWIVQHDESPANTILGVPLWAKEPQTWSTVHQTGYSLVGESNPTMNPANVHNANRYAVMAINNPTVNNDPNITRFLGGTLTVTDYAAVRK